MHDRSRDAPAFGAGILTVRRDVLILSLRSAAEREPYTWCCFGGSALPGEGPMRCAIRECEEESGIDVSRRNLHLVDDSTSEWRGFRYFTFLATVPDDAVAIPSLESASVGEFPLGRTPETLWAGMPAPLHSGMARLVRKPEVALRILRAIAQEVGQATA